MTRARRLSFAVALLVLGACARRRAEPPRPATLAVEVAGCAVILATGDGGTDAACEPPPSGELRLFVSAASGGGKVEARAAGHPLALTSARASAEGELFSVLVPPGATALEVRRVSRVGERDVIEVREVALARGARPAFLDDADDKRKKGALDEAEVIAKAHLTAPEVRDRAAAEGLLARIAMRRADVEGAAAHFKRAIALDREAGLVSARADDTFALSFLLHQRARRYEEARRALAEIEGSLGAYPEGRARLPLYRAQIAWETGDARAALRDLGVAITSADRVGATAIGRAARQVQGMVACTAGSARACVAALRRSVEELDAAGDAPACERAEVLLSLGFAEVEAAEATGEIDAARLEGPTRRGLALLEGQCPDAYMRSVAHQHLALAAVTLGNVAEARAQMTKARALVSSPRLSDALEWELLDGRIAELERRPAVAAASFDRALALARIGARRSEEWRALVGLGRVLEGAGRADAALLRYREAEGVLDALVEAVPFGEGRAGAAADGSESSRRAAGLLATRGALDEAVGMIRAARARAARSLAVASSVDALDADARARWDRAVADYRAARAAIDDDAASDWKRPGVSLPLVLEARRAALAELRSALERAIAALPSAGRSGAPAPIAESDTLLVLARLGPRRDAYVIAGRRGALHAHLVKPFSSGDPGSVLSASIVEPVASTLSGASRVVVVSDDALAWVDVHALLLSRVPLVATTPVVYSLGLPARAAPSGATGASVVIADPTADLPSARAEGATVARALATRGEVRTFVARESTAANVKPALEGAGLLHYAGHGVLAGREGSESRLPLAGGSALAIGDVITMRRAPRFVVLSGCEAGGPVTAGEGGVGMAQAFLVAGSDLVVAPVRVVDDTTAGALASSLHGEVDGGASHDLASALARAQAEAARRGARGWEAFRAFVP